MFKGFSIVGLLVVLGIVGYLTVRSLNSSTTAPITNEGAPGQNAIERADDVEEQIQDAAEQRQLPE